MRRAIASTERSIAVGDWRLASVPPAATRLPGELDALSPEWLAASVPGTVAAAREAAGRFTLGQTPGNFDEGEHWYRCAFSARDRGDFSRLRFAGLATLSEAWLNGQPILTSDNMFVEHVVDVTQLLHDDNVLDLRFRSLESAFKERRPPGRWRTGLVSNSKLRFFRTTLLGRTPAWSPPVVAVGPWRPITLETSTIVETTSLSLTATMDGSTGIVRARLNVRTARGRSIAGASLVVGGAAAAMEILSHDGDVTMLHGELHLPDVERWWPHTHGAQPLYDVRASLQLAGGDTVGVELGRVGFRTIEVDRTNGAFALRINGVPVFCRGSVWTTVDLLTLGGSAAQYRETLGLVRSAGMNMVRVNGVLFYESPAFHDLCDELGVLVWQDFMFSSMDYPSTDPAFAASVRTEVTQALGRLAGRPSLAVLCGNSEVEMQAAMLGVPQAEARNPLFYSTIAEICAASRPDVPYLAGTPEGDGDSPLHVRQGVSHYYGIGAYLRPLSEARRDGVRFAAESLGNANVPVDRSLRRFLPEDESSVSFAWKVRSPRQYHARWDFDDIRDHYLRVVFGVDPVEVRSREFDRYLAMSRAVTGAVMAHVFAEWRRVGSACAGGMTWFLRDLWDGPGWGLIDAGGLPKPAYHVLRRVLSPIAVLISDEGLDGLDVHALNDTPQALTAELRIAFFREGEIAVASAARAVTIPAHGSLRLSADGLLGRFTDSAYAYKFGPPAFDLVHAALVTDGASSPLAEAFHAMPGTMGTRVADVGLSTQVAPAGGGFALTVRTRKYAQFVRIEGRDLLADDDFFHLPPGGEKTVFVRKFREGVALSGHALALNSHAAARFVAP